MDLYQHLASTHSRTQEDALSNSLTTVLTHAIETRDNDQESRLLGTEAP